MELCIRPRRKGKTNEAVKLVRKDPTGVLVVISERERDRILCQYSLPSDKVVHVGRMVTGGLLGRGHVNVYLDNADVWLSSLIHQYGGVPRWASLTDDPFDYSVIDRHARAFAVVEKLKEQRSLLETLYSDAAGSVLLSEHPLAGISWSDVRKLKKTMRSCALRLRVIETLLPPHERKGAFSYEH